MREYETNYDALTAQVEFDQKNVVDVGCGDGALARKLVELGARVIGIEPNLASWRRAELESPGLKIQDGTAEQLEIEDGWADVVIFMYSLHHVPVHAMQSSVKQAHRVLKSGGLLYVAEPIATGSYQTVCESFLDETTIRQQARDTMNTVARPLFETSHEFNYQISEKYQDFEAFVNEMMRYSLGRYQLNDIDNQQVKNKFEQTFRQGHYWLDQPVTCWLLSNPN